MIAEKFKDSAVSCLKRAVMNHCKRIGIRQPTRRKMININRVE